LPLNVVPVVAVRVIRSFGNQPCLDELLAVPVTVTVSFAPGLAHVAVVDGAFVFGPLPLYVATNLYTPTADETKLTAVWPLVGYVLSPLTSLEVAVIATVTQLSGP
jgi:hypothetical protein